MITRENGNIVQTVNGTRHVYGVADPEFGVLMAILSKQEGAARTNAITARTYNDMIANMQISADAGHALTQPPKPLMLIISDDGDDIYAPFDPPLKDLKATPPVKVNPGTGSGVSALPGGVGGLTAAEQRAQFNMISALYHDRFNGGV